MSSADSELGLNVLTKYVKNSVYTFIGQCQSPVAVIYQDKTMAHLMKGFLGIDDSQLREKGVEKQLWLSPNMLLDQLSNCKSVVFFARPEVSTCEIIRENCDHNQDFLRNIRVFCYFVPFQRQSCSRALQTASGTSMIQINTQHNLPCPFFSLRSDLLSIEQEHAFSDLFIRDRFELLHCLALGLNFIQSKHGAFKRVITKGDLASKVAEILQSKSTEAPRPEKIEKIRFDTLVLIDRDVDLLTPLAIPMTYEALLDDVVGINCGMVKVPPDADDSKRIRLQGDTFHALDTVDIR